MAKTILSPLSLKKGTIIAGHRLCEIHRFQSVGIIGYRFRSVRQGQDEIGVETFINDLKAISEFLLDHGHEDRLVEVPRETMPILLEDHDLPMVDMVLPYRPDWTSSVSSDESGNFLKYSPEKRAFQKRPFTRLMVRAPQGPEFMVVFFDADFGERNFGNGEN